MCVFQDSKHLDTKTPGSRAQDAKDLWRMPEHSSLFWPVAECLKGHIHQTTNLHKNTRHQDEWDSFIFLSLPDTLYLLSVFNKLCSHLLSACIIFLCVQSQGISCWSCTTLPGSSDPISLHHKHPKIYRMPDEIVCIQHGLRPRDLFYRQ